MIIRKKFKKLVLINIFLLLILNLIDYFGTFFIILVAPEGVMVEKNPIMRWAFQTHVFIPLIIKLLWLTSLYLFSILFINSDVFDKPISKRIFNFVYLFAIFFYFVIDSIVLYNVAWLIY